MKRHNVESMNGIFYKPQPHEIAESEEQDRTNIKALILIRKSQNKEFQRFLRVKRG